MSRRRAAQRPRGHAEAGPDAKACVRAASRIASTTAESSRPSAPFTNAQALVCSTSWLLSLRDWLVEELDLAVGEAVQLRRADVERISASLTRCVACLDTVTAGPTQLPPLDKALTESTPSPAVSCPRTLQ